MIDILNVVWYLLAKQLENAETPPLNDVHHRDFLLEPGKMIAINKKLNRKCQEDVWVIFIQKQVSKESSNVVWYLQAKQAENTESSPLKYIRHHKSLVEPGIMITININWRGSFSNNTKENWLGKIRRKCV